LLQGSEIAHICKQVMEAFNWSVVTCFDCWGDSLEALNKTKVSSSGQVLRADSLNSAYGWGHHGVCRIDADWRLRHILVNLSAFHET